MDAHLGCFHHLAILNGTSVNTCVQISIWVLSFNYFAYICNLELLGYMAILFNFWEIAKLFSTMVTPFYIPTMNVERFHFFSILTNACYFPLFFFFWFWIIVIVVSVKWYLPMTLICIFLITRDVEHLFICWPFVHLLWRSVC